MKTPLRFCAIGFGFTVCVNKINAILPISPKGSRALLKEAKQHKRWIDATCRRPGKSLILLEDQYIIVSPFSSMTLYSRICKAIEEIDPLGLTNADRTNFEDAANEEDSADLLREYEEELDEE